MELPSDIQLDTDIESAVTLLDLPRAEPQFALPRNLFHARKARERSVRRGIKQFIRPENARAILDHLPVEPDDRTHCILRGDFILCDIIPLLIGFSGRCPHLRIATLGMSIGNADTLACMVERGLVEKLTIVVSLYFQQLDKATTFREVSARLKNVATLAITRSHAKIILIPTTAGDSFIIEGSANLRSSDNLEQMLIINDPETLEFHASWIDHLAQR